ncbi:MAG: hypothetical protein AAFO07_27695 [Bacteroidota bacterium]
MRFENEKAFVIAPGILKHMQDLFLAKNIPDENDPDHKHSLRLNLLVFGFSMRNYALMQLIKETLVKNDSGITLWLFDIDPKLATYITKELSKEEINEKRYSIKFIHLTKERALGHALENLWKTLENLFEDPFKPRNIKRHNLTFDLFKDLSPLDLMDKEYLNPRISTYYEDRLRVEIAIEIILSDGMIHLSFIPNSRVGKFLLLVQDRQQKQNKEPKNIHQYLKEFDMEIFGGFMYDTYLLIDKRLYENTARLFEHIRKKLYQNCESTNLRNYFSDAKTVKRFKEDIAEGIRKRRLLMINPKFQHTHDHLFNHLPVKQVMNTSFGWIYRYRKFIDNRLDDNKFNTWDLMLGISEFGRFLNKDLGEGVFKNKCLDLILASNGLPDKAKKISNHLSSNKEGTLGGRIRYRPWWIHNKHMVLFLKYNPNKEMCWTNEKWEQNWDLVAGFFYRQNMLARRINPVHLTMGENNSNKESHFEDLKKLLYIYAIYWRGSQLEPTFPLDNDGKIEVVTHKEKILVAINYVLGYYESILKNVSV